MNAETWFVLSVAAAFLLLGIAGSPLAWVALQHRKSHLENLLETRWNELAAELRRLEGRLALAEQAGQSARGKQDLVSSENGSSTNGRGLPNRPFLSTWRRMPETRFEPQDDDKSLISVPNLAAAPEDRDLSPNPLSQRYAAIWCSPTRRLPRCDRPGNRPADRPDRVDTRPEATHRRIPNDDPPCAPRLNSTRPGSTPGQAQTPASTEPARTSSTCSLRSGSRSPFPAGSSGSEPKPGSLGRPQT